VSCKRPKCSQPQRNVPAQMMLTSADLMLKGCLA